MICCQLPFGLYFNIPDAGSYNHNPGSRRQLHYRLFESPAYTIGPLAKSAKRLA